jgi:hypothetical protein
VLLHIQVPVCVSAPQGVQTMNGDHTLPLDTLKRNKAVQYKYNTKIILSTFFSTATLCLKKHKMLEAGFSSFTTKEVCILFCWVQQKELISVSEMCTPNEPDLQITIAISFKNSLDNKKGLPTSKTFVEVFNIQHHKIITYLVASALDTKTFWGVKFNCSGRSNRTADRDEIWVCQLQKQIIKTLRALSVWLHFVYIGFPLTFRLARLSDLLPFFLSNTPLFC